MLSWQSCQFCKEECGEEMGFAVFLPPKNMFSTNTFRFVAWDKLSQTAADSDDWKNSYMSDVDFETAGAKAAGACVKALNSGLGDSRQIVCFKAVIYELLGGQI